MVRISTKIIPAVDEKLLSSDQADNCRISTDNENKNNKKKKPPGTKMFLAVSAVIENIDKHIPTDVNI